MSRIEEMLKEMCPDGVEYKKLDDVCTIRNGYTPSKKHMEYWENGTVPWFRMDDIRTHGRVLSDSLQHVTPQAVKGQLFQADSLIFATTATIGEHAIISVPFLCNQRFTVLTIRDEMKEAIEPRYLFHYGFIIDEWCKRNTKSGTMAAVDMNRFREIEIPVPPLAVQREVVRVLDTMTELTTELTAELTAELATRTKQYAYYRDELLKLEGVEGVEYVKLGNLSDDSTIRLGRGNVISKKYLKDHFGPYPVYSSAQTNDGIIGYCNSYMFDDIRITWSIDGGGKFFYRDGQYSVTNVCGWCKVLREDLIIPKYLYYALSNAWTYKDYNYTHKAHPSTIKEEYIIPVPPLAVQQEVVRVLDTMTKLTTELTSKLNAELPAREKQYAYYRDRMLSFPIKK